MGGVLGVFVEPGAVRAVELDDDRAVLEYPDGTWRFRHRCDRSHRHAGTVVCAPALQIGPHAPASGGGHRIEQSDPLTIAPSILCLDCGTHGFVQSGRWVGC